MERKTALLIFCLTLVMTEATVIGSKKYKKYCNKVGDLPSNCLDIRCRGSVDNDVYTIYPTKNIDYAVEAYCDQTTEGGGWTVFQRRMNGEEDFYRKWKDYQLGFGDLNSEFWLGNDLIAKLTAQNKKNELRVDLEKWDNVKPYAHYSTFGFADESDLYRLEVGGYSGNAGDSMSRHSNSPFSTQDYDHDIHSGNCAEKYHGAWWYEKCHDSNLNGKYVIGGDHSSYGDGINWRYSYGYYYSMKVTEMKFRPQLD